MSLFKSPRRKVTGESSSLVGAFSLSGLPLPREVGLPLVGKGVSGSMFSGDAVGGADGERTGLFLGIVIGAEART